MASRTQHPAIVQRYLAAFATRHFLVEVSGRPSQRFSASLAFLIPLVNLLADRPDCVRPRPFNRRRARHLEIRTPQNPGRLLRRADFKMSGPAPIEWPRTDAVRSIRQQVYERDKECQRCGKPLTWATGHLDEKVSRGEGGEIDRKST